MYSRDNKIMRKLLGKATPDNSTDTSAPSLGITSAPHLQPAYRPSASQYVSYDAKYPLLSIDASSDHRAALLASGHVLKTVLFDGLAVKEGVDVRAAIVAASNPIKSAASSGASDQLSVKDAKFANDTTIFTACSNGKIFSYDVARIATGGSPMDCVQMREDSRQVNTIDVNPHWVSTLLSGSQDGYIRYFDIRAPVQSRAGGMTYKARASFKCNADGVRHAKWSPKDGYQLACGTENGAVLKWDVRKPNTPLLRITAHEKHCNSISWHPDGNHLISGGWDQRCAVWDLSKTADKRQKPKWVVQTPAPVSCVAWRPALWSASSQGKRAAQIAVSYESASVARYGIKAAHIWDLARPSMPFKELDWFNSPPSGMIWTDQDILWTVGDDGRFHQCDVAFAPKVVDRVSTSSVAFSSRGDVAMFLDERPHQRPRPAVVHHQEASAAPRSPYGSSPTTPMLSISRSDSEDDVMGSFLGPKRRTGGRKRRSSLRSTPALSTTPPSGPGTADELLGLEQAMKMTGFFKTQQAMAVGRMPSATKVNNYQYLTQCYLETIQHSLPSVPGCKSLVQRVTSIMEAFACAAESVEQFRLAQTWRVLAYAINLLLTRRAQYHLEARLGQFAKVPSMIKIKDSDKTGDPKLLNLVRDAQPLRRSSAVSATIGGSLSARSLLSEEIESTSNVPTPVARPVQDDDEYRPGMTLTPVAELDNFSLPPAASMLNHSPRKRLDSAPLSITSQESDGTQMSSTEGYDFYDTDALAHAIDVPAIPEKAPQKPPAVMRHDSDDGFAHMFSMSNSSRKTALPEMSGARQSRIDTVDENEDEGREDEGREYESRIRGREIQTEEPDPRHRPLRPADSPEDLFMISQTTMGSDTLGSEEPTSQQSESFTLGHAFNDHAPLHVGVVPSSPAIVRPDTHRLDTTPTIIESDYLAWAEDPPYPYPLASSPAPVDAPPLDPYVLLTRALDFELRTSVVNAAAMILLLKPLVPDSVIDPHRAGSILRTHHARLSSMRLFVEAALLRNLCVQGWPEGLPEWGENYTAIFGPAQQGVKGGLLCPNCRKPREIDPKKGPNALWQCDRCKVHMAPCAVCGHREASAAVLPVAEGLAKASRDEEIMSVWWYCPGCAHGGHATCIQGWHAPSGLDEPASADGFDGSDGCCPLDGCGHACLPGKWRDEKTLLRSDEVGRAAVEKARSHPPPRKSNSATGSPMMTPMGGPVRDGIEVPQSRAVDSVRETLAGAAAAWAGGGGRPAHNSMGGHQAPGASILSSSPGRATERGDRERRKSVKFVPTER